MLPTHKRRFNVLKAPFVYKKAVHQYQYDTHKRLIELYGQSSTGADATNVVHFLRYLEHALSDVHMMSCGRDLLPVDGALRVDAHADGTIVGIRNWYAKEGAQTQRDSRQLKNASGRINSQRLSKDQSNG